MKHSLFALILVLSSTHFATAKTLVTAMNGTDSDLCGPTANPCRSISQAIENAAAGDTVLVGPGFYGDLNNDLAFNDPGDEHAEGGAGCNCVVKLDKRLTLKSRDGAAVTTIDGDGVVPNGLRVLSGAEGSTIGGSQNGFTLTRTASTGLQVFSVERVRVIGNVAERNLGEGLSIFSEDGAVTNNRSFGNGDWGIALSGNGLVA